MPDVNDTRLDRNRREYEALTKLLGDILDLQRWGFVPSFARVRTDLPVVTIYDSEWCRVRTAVGGGDQHAGREIGIAYGRLHASNENEIMRWNGQDCRCWHQVHAALRFLDGLSPQEAVEQSDRRKELPEAVERFRHSRSGRQLNEGTPFEWMIRLHAALWDQYGKRLFELYDLRRPALWEQYVRFVREYHRIQGYRPVPGFPAYDRIC